MMDEREIRALEDAGAKRWTKGAMDRLYINAELIGLDVSYYKTGNVSNATWQGKTVSNADGRRLHYSKIWIDIRDGSLHVRTDYKTYAGTDGVAVEDAAKKFVDEVRSS